MTKLNDFRKLKAIMVEHGDKQRDLAEYLGITENSLSRKLNGIRPWKLPECEKIARKYKVSMDIFFTN